MFLFLHQLNRCAYFKVTAYFWKANVIIFALSNKEISIIMASQQRSSKAIHILLWVAQAVLAAMFLMAGAMKSTQPIEKLSQMMPWAGQIPEALVRFIGVSELLGAIGLLLPALLRIKPNLTPLAAVGLATIQLFAAAFHISRGETSVIGMNIALFLVAAFIAWGRFKKEPIQAKL